MKHLSDCAQHNPPALPIAPCDCGAEEEAWYKQYLLCNITKNNVMTLEEFSKWANDAWNAAKEGV